MNMEEIIVRIERETPYTSTQLELTFQRSSVSTTEQREFTSVDVNGTSPPASRTFLDRLESVTMNSPYPEDIDEEIAYILALMSDVSIGIEAFAPHPNPIDIISKEKYTAFTSRRFKKADALKGFHQDNCVICTEKFKSNQKIPTLPCRHDFHWKCLGKWVTNQKKTCPICKANVC